MSFIAYTPETDFPIQNLPWGVVATPAGPAVATRVGDTVVNVKVLVESGLLKGDYAASLTETTLNSFMALGKASWSQARKDLTALLAAGSASEAAVRDSGALLDASAVQPLMPARVGDYTDFYASRDHATNVGTMFRGKDNALQPNWLHLPVGYHGRASSVVPSGTDVRRPKGQLRASDDVPPTHGACRLLDYEVEMGFFVGTGNKLGDPMTVQQAKDSIFGYVILNDWSARDIQKWEYVPLGPFGAKNFASTISPWIVTAEALEPFAVAGPTQEDPPVLDYLKESQPSHFSIDITAAVHGNDVAEPHVITKTNMRHLYWSTAQMLAHHSVTGCNMQPGDLLGTGTISGPEKEAWGSMLELCWRGQEEIPFPNGATRKFLKDGDTVTMAAHAQGNGFRIGFGECVGKVLPAHE